MRRPGVLRRRPKRVNKYGKARMNCVINAELYYWIQGYAEENQTSVTQLIVEHFNALRERWIAEHTAEQI